MNEIGNDNEVNREPEIPRNSYTALRLYNSTPEQADRDSRVTIIGPISTDWVRRNKDSWGSRKYLRMRQVLPHMSNTLRRITKTNRSQDSIQQLNAEVINHLELSPTTSTASGADNDEQWSDVDENQDVERQGIREEQQVEDSGSSEEDEWDRSNGILGSDTLLPQSSSKRYLLHNVTEEEGENDDSSREGNDVSRSSPIQMKNRPTLETVPMASSTSYSSYVTAHQSFNSSVEDISNRDETFSAHEYLSNDEDEREIEQEGGQTPKAQDGFRPGSPVSGNLEEPYGTSLSPNESTATITPKPSKSGLAVSTSTVTDGGSLARTSTAKDYLNSLLDVEGKGKKVVRINTENGLQYGKRLTDTVGQAVGTTAGVAKWGAKKGTSKITHGGRKLKRRGTKLINVSAMKILRRKKQGEIVRVDKMLVAVKIASASYLSPEFNEMEHVEARVLERWKEYIVVARTTGDAANPISLQFYTTRNIAKIEDSSHKAKSKLDLKLGPDFQVNLYSSLDKSLALWKSTDKGTQIYLFQTRSTYAALEWLAFFAGVIGTRRENIVHLQIPDLGVKADVNLPIKEVRKLLREEPQENVRYSDIISYTSTPSRPVAMLLQKAIGSVSQIDGLKEIIEREWSGQVKLGLAWKRYDRLEWVFDVNESQFQSSWAMARTHDLELRPKSAYARPVVFEDGKEMEEPTPIEGFLIRHSSWSGEAKANKLFFRKTYLHTHDNLLFYCRAMRAVPPYPDNYTRSTEDLEEDWSELPTIYDISPFGVNPATGRPEWLTDDITPDQFEANDKAALFEIQRRVMCIERSDGFIDLREVAAVYALSPDGRDPENYTSESEENSSDDQSIDPDEIFLGTEFEIALESGAVLRLEAHNRFTRDKWVKSLSELIRYWKRKMREDIDRTHQLRQKNLDILQIDEDMDAFVSEAAPKWETDRGMADPLTYTISGVSWSRSIHMKGMLYQKPSKFATFSKYYCVLCYGDLILHSPYDRDSSGVARPSLSYDKVQTINLRDCYIYSGSLTSMDLLDRDKWFDKENPGRHALPRAYSDGWKSAEEEPFRCFVLWFAKKRVINMGGRKSSKRKDANSGLKMVNRLGVNGTGMVFMCRSRQERDRWVSALKIEIGRLADNIFEDISITE